GHVAPAHAVARRREYDVVRAALLAEAAVLPGDVDRPVAGDLRGRERACPQVACDAVEADVRNRDRLVPGRPAVVGGERRDGPVQALERHDHASARLHDRLTAEALIVTSRLDRHAPVETTVRRRAHQLAVTFAEVVELRVAVPTERARGVV